MIDGKVKNTNYGSKVNLTLAKAHRILDHYKVNRKFKRSAGIENKNLYLVLKTFEAALETICREVFPHAKLLISLPDVVRKATGGVCAEDLVPSREDVSTSESGMNPGISELLEQNAAASAEPQTVETGQTAGGAGIVSGAITRSLFAATSKDAPMQTAPPGEVRRSTDMDKIHE